jgi:hypothetical protein
VDDGIILSMTMAGEDGTLESSTKTNVTREAGNDVSVQNDTEEEKRPPLPPRPTGLQTPPRPSSPSPLVSRTTATKKPQLQSQPTTALSSVDIQTLSFPDGTRGTFSTSNDQPDLAPISGSRKVSQNGSEINDSASVTSFAPTLRVGGDLESLLGNGFNTQSPAWKLLSSQTDSGHQFESIEFDEDDRLSSFEHEFDEVADVDVKGGNEGKFYHMI